jgi:transposase-like protein
MSRIRYSAEVRQQALALLLDSRLSRVQVAREIGCTVGTLHLWLKQHRQQKEQATESTTPPTFIPVNVVDLQNPSAEIILPNGITIRLTDATPRILAELVHALIPC